MEMITAIEDGTVTTSMVLEFWKNAKSHTPFQAIGSPRNVYLSTWNVGKYVIKYAERPRRTTNGREYYAKLWEVWDEENNMIAECSGLDYYITLRSDGRKSILSDTQLERVSEKILGGPFASIWEAKRYI